MNAQEIYESNDKQGKAPGQFVMLKSVKKKIKDNDNMFYNKVKDGYHFSPALLSEYEQSFKEQEADKEEKELVTEIKKALDTKKDEWYDIVYAYSKDQIGDHFTYVMDKAFQHLIGLNTARLSNDFDVKDPWKSSDVNIKMAIASFLAPFTNELRVYGKKADKHYLNRLFGKYIEALQPYLVLSKTDVLFECKNHNVKMSRTRRLKKVSK